MNINKLVMFNHDVFCGSCDAYDLLMFLVRLKSNWSYATCHFCSGSYTSPNGKKFVH